MTLHTYVYDANASLPAVLVDERGRYVWGVGLAYSVSGTGSGTPLVYHTDALSSVRAITDVSGALVQTRQTDEFGVVAQTQGTATQPFGYTGQPEDTDTTLGLVDLRARAYMPSIGRFLSRDAFSGLTTAPATLNRFTYALTNRVLIVDPSGFDGNNNVLQNTTPGKCAPPLLPAAMQMLFDATFCGQSVRSSKQDQQLDYRPQIQCGGLPSIGFGCVAAAGWWAHRSRRPKIQDSRASSTSFTGQERRPGMVGQPTQFDQAWATSRRAKIGSHSTGTVTTGETVG